MFSALSRLFTRPINVIHIPKTGGSALRAAIEVEPTGKKVLWHDHHVRLHDVPRGRPVIFFLRDPVSRYLSGFNSRLRRGAPRYHYPWTEKQARLFQAFPSANQLAEGLSADNENTRRLAHSAFDDIRMITPYRFWFKGLDEIESRRDDIVFVGFQEELDGDVGHLSTYLGLTKPLQLPRDDKSAHRAPADTDRYLSDLARANLETIYAEDRKIYDRIRAMKRDLIDQIRSRAAQVAAAWGSVWVLCPDLEAMTALLA